MKKQKISDAVIHRLPRYYRYLDDLYNKGVVRISSNSLGAKMDITASQIRQDLSCFGEFGQQGYGYNVAELRAEIGHILGIDSGHRIIVIGVGHLGHALLQNFDFTKKNPKLIYINPSEELITLEDTVYTVFLNLLGFDVLYFIPTGYNMEGHLNQKLMEEHQTGEFLYDLQIPDWSTVPLTIHTSWRDKLFRRG